jgi:serine/threonine protein kinase
MTEPIVSEPRSDGRLRTAQDWLGALSSGACGEDAFLRAVQELTRNSPDEGWGLLSLLDQYYRRGKIKPDVFRTLKSRLEGQLLGPALHIDVSVPLSQIDAPLPAPHTAPIVSSASGAAAVRSRIADFAAHVPGREIPVGAVLRGRYQIQGVLGRGGTGTVFEAIDLYRLDLPNAGQRLAIKVLHAAATERPELLTELRREFQYLQSLSHPNIVRVHEYDRDGDTAFFTMEYLSGLSLNSVLSARHQTALNRPHALTIIRDVGAALAHAHSRGVVHGDLNPGNIFITDVGDVRVLDFGASHGLHRGPWISQVESSEQTPIAAPRYASCQLLEGNPAEVRDDLYAFACIVYVLLAGKHPFGEHTAIAARTLRLAPHRPAGLTWEQWRALRSGLSVDSDQRPTDVEEWLKPFGLHEAASRLPELLELLSVSPRKRGRIILPVISAAILVMLAAGWSVAVNFESATRVATTLRVGMKTTLATTQSLLWKLWHGAPVAAGIADEATAKLPATSVPAAVDSSGASHTPRALPPMIASSARPTGTTSAPAPAPAPAPASASASAPASATAPAPAPALSSTSVSHAGIATPHAVAATHVPKAAALRSRIELAADTIDVPRADPAARIVVRRSGNLHGDASFSWWTESGTAKPGQDFAPIARREEHIEDGKSAMSLFIPVVADTTRRRPKSFYVVIRDPSPGAILGARTLTMVTIPPSQ